MGFFKKHLRLKPLDFYPDFSISEYDNWLNFLGAGGSTRQWEKLKSVNKWKFAEDPFEKYQKEVKPISDRYFSLMNKIQEDWSALYDSKNYQGPLAERMEQDCLIDIDYYEKMLSIDMRYGMKIPENINIPALKRLAMLYERQGRFDESIAVCMKACALGMNESGRMKKLLKKIRREPTPDEIRLINKFSQNK